jgi:hypothetical protein
MRNATFYTALPGLPRDVLARLVPEATVTASSSGDVDRLVVAWSDAVTTVNVLPDAGRADHLSGFEQYAVQVGAREGDDVIARIRTTRTVLGVVTEGPEAVERHEALLRSLTRELDAIVFREHGLVFGPDGRMILPVEETSEAEDEDEVLHPPTLTRVVHRALALCAVTARGFWEGEEGEAAATRIAEMRRWLTVTGVEDELEPDEVRILWTPHRKLSPRDVVTSTWRSEGLAVLAWYLGLATLPPHDELCFTLDLYEVLDFMRAPPAKLVERAAVRDEATIANMASQLLGLHWRMRELRLRGKPVDFRAFARACWFGTMYVEGVPFAGDDLAVSGVPVSEAREADVSRTMSIAYERHLAINWLRGFHAVYSETDVST